MNDVMMTRVLNWPEIVEKSNLSGVEKLLAMNCVPIELYTPLSGNNIPRLVLGLDGAASALFTEKREKKIAELFSGVFGIDINVSILVDPRNFVEDNVVQVKFNRKERDEP